VTINALVRLLGSEERACSQRRGRLKRNSPATSGSRPARDDFRNSRTAISRTVARLFQIVSMNEGLLSSVKKAGAVKGRVRVDYPRVVATLGLIDE
jgi:hypothetical protein